MDTIARCGKASSYIERGSGDRGAKSVEAGSCQMGSLCSIQNHRCTARSCSDPAFWQRAKGVPAPLSCIGTISLTEYSLVSRYPLSASSRLPPAFLQQRDQAAGPHL